MNYRDTVKRLDSRLRIGASFDIIKRDITVGGRTGTLYCIDGFTKDEVVFKMLLSLTGLKPEQMKGVTAASDFVARYITYTEAETTTDLDRVVTQVLSGASAMVVEGLDQVVLIDVRTYPVRSVGEPETDRVLRGSRDKKLLSVGLDQLSTYGLMKTTGRAEIRELADHLEGLGYLSTESEHRTLQLTPKAAQVLYQVSILSIDAPGTAVFRMQQ